MQLVQRDNWRKHYLLSVIRSFLVWSFTLTVCLLIVGFPMVILVTTVGAALTVILQSVLPISAVLLVAGGIIGVHVVAIFALAAVLTFRGIYPHEVSWLSWLNGEAQLTHTSVYASCPLTCELTI